MYIKLNKELFLKRIKADGEIAFQEHDFQTFDYHLDQQNGALIVKVGTKIGDFEFTLPYLIEFELEMLTFAAKQINKMKAALESTK